MTAAYLAENMKLLRKRMGLTQQEVAQRIGISAGAYNNYESGKRQVPPDTLEALGDVLEINGYDLQHTDLAEFPEGTAMHVYPGVKGYELSSMPKEELVAYCRSLQQEVKRLRTGMAQQKAWRAEVLDILGAIHQKK